MQFLRLRKRAGLGIVGTAVSHIAAPSSAKLRPSLYLAMIFALLLAATCSAQQITGSISGTVLDASGAVVPQATVTAANTATGFSQKTVSNGDGLYIFPTLPTGTYTITAEKEGFSKATLSGIVLQVYQKAVINVTLQTGRVTERVTVEARAPLIDTASASLGTEVETRAIQDLPLNLRQVGALALTVPNTVDSTGRSLTTLIGNGSGVSDNSFSGAGGFSGSNILLIDGMLSRALNNGSFALNPPPDMVREFKIQNNVYDAGFGSTSAAVMNLVTQSGTNSYHGGVWEYLRNRDMDARQFFQTPQVLSVVPQHTRNQFGATFGGPILKDKLFFFLGYEGLRESRGAVTSNGAGVRVPTTAQKQGNFSDLLTGTTQNLCGPGGPANLNFDTGQLFDPASESFFTCPNSGATIVVGNPVPGNIITNLDPVAQKFLPFFHDPNAVDPAGRPVYANPTPYRRTDNQYDARLDYNISNKDMVFARYMLGTGNQFLPGPFDPFNSAQLFRGHNFVVGWTHVFNPNTINDLRVGYQRNYLRLGCAGCPRPAGTMESFGITNLKAVRPDLEEYPNVLFQNGFATLGDGFPGFYPDIIPDSLTKYEDTFTKIIGRHNLAFGFDLNTWNTDGVQDPAQVNGLIFFAPNFSVLPGGPTESQGTLSVADLADMELGFPSFGDYTQNPIVTRLVGGRWLSFFVQDNMKLTHKLSVEVGLRWEHRTMPYDRNNAIAALYPLSNNSTPGDAFFLTALPDAQNDALCADPYFASPITGKCVIMSSSLRKQVGLSSDQIQRLSTGDSFHNFAPRLGISYSPLASGKLVIHTGAGIFYDIPVTNPMGANANNNPVFTRTPTYFGAFGGPPPLTNGQPTTTANMFIEAAAAPIAASRSLIMPSPFYHIPTVYQWSLSTQSQLLRDTALELGYIGNKGIHLDYYHGQGNQPSPNPDPSLAQLFRPWPDIGSMQFDSYTGYGNYNALYMKLTQRLRNGLSGLVSYTYGKTLNDNPSNSDFDTIPQNDNNPKADYGVYGNSVRHRLVISGIYQLPFGRGRSLLSNSKGVINGVVGGWELSTIISAQSGYPFTVFSPIDYSNTGSGSPRPDRTCSGVLSNPTITRWFDSSCFTTDALAAVQFTNPRFGNSGRNILTGPGLVNMDLSVLKRFHVVERLSGEFLVQAFNLFNHPNFGTPDSVVNDGTTGQIFTTVPAGVTGSNRELQIALRFNF